VIRRSAPIFAAFVLVAVAASAKDKKPEPRPFEMTVVDPAGVALTGVDVVVKNAAAETIAVTTDAAGKTTGIFPDTTASYTVDLSKARFRPQHQTLNFATQKFGKKETAVIKFTLEPMTALDDYSAAIKAIQAKDLPTAEANLNLAVATDPNFVKGFEVLAMVQLEQKKLAEGLASAEKTLTLDAANVSALRSRYDALEALGRAEDAERALYALAEKERTPDVARLLYNAGAHAMSAKQNDKSKAYLNKAVELDPNLHQGHAGLAELAIADKNYAEAVRQLDLAIGIAPRNFKAFERKIEVLKADNKAKEAAAVEAELAKRKAEG
jgi:tetratricopeptide (TPR) repeat protein